MAKPYLTFKDATPKDTISATMCRSPNGHLPYNS